MISSFGLDDRHRFNFNDLMVEMPLKRTPLNRSLKLQDCLVVGDRGGFDPLLVFLEWGQRAGQVVSGRVPAGRLGGSDKSPDPAAALEL